MPYKSRNQGREDRFGPESCPDATIGTGPPRRNSWVGRLAILFVILLALGPVLYFEVPNEIARWYQAAAMERWLAGDRTGALGRLEESLRWAPGRADAFVWRGDWRLENQEFQKAIDDYNAAMERDPGQIMALINRSQAFQHLGLHEKAVQDWKKLVDLRRSAPAAQRAVLLNGLAYAQALGDFELKLALENIIQAINLNGANAAMLDTRGYIHFRRGDFEIARKDLDPAVRAMEVEVKVKEQERNYIDRREFERELKELRKSLAVIRYHRALVLDGLGKVQEAESDRRRVRELGYTPAPSLF